MIVGKCNCEEKNGTDYTSGNNNCRNYGNFEKIYGTFYSIIVAIMAILKQRIQLTPDDTIVAIVAIVEKKKQI